MNSSDADGSVEHSENQPGDVWVDRSAEAAEPIADTSPADPSADRPDTEGPTESEAVFDSSAAMGPKEANGNGSESSLLDRLARALRGDRSTLGPRPYDPDEHGSLATFETDPAFEERDRYWVNFPYALVVITADPATNALTYRVVEPALDSVERELLAVLEDDVRDPLLYRSADATDNAEPETLLRRELDRRLAEYDVAIFPPTAREPLLLSVSLLPELWPDRPVHVRSPYRGRLL
jgi:flagellar protein FlaI